MFSLELSANVFHFFVRTELSNLTMKIENPFCDFPRSWRDARMKWHTGCLKTAQALLVLGCCVSYVGGFERNELVAEFN